MTAQELRIDNWVYNSYTKQNTQVHPMMIPQLHRLEKEKGSLKDCNIEPIPLTEEILLKVSTISKQEGYPYKFLKGYLKMRNGVFFYKYYGIEVELPYLHQLQNLYFALTGEELKTEL